MLWFLSRLNWAGRAGGLKRRKKNQVTKTPHQTGIGVRMEMFWPKGMHQKHLPFVANSRQHLVFDDRFKRWMVMWYRQGIQVFKKFRRIHRAEQFEQTKVQSLILYNQLKGAHKLGNPGPDICRSGVRGVFFDNVKSAWVARFHEGQVQNFEIFRVEDYGFQEAYHKAVAFRMRKLKDLHKFVLQRSRHRLHTQGRPPLGTAKT